MRWRELFFPADHRFVHLLGEQAQQAVRACALLAGRGGPADMAGVEAAGDDVRRTLCQALARTYATPFDRDDIFTLSSALDDVVDTAQDALLTVTVLGGWDYAHLEEMCRAVLEGAQALGDAVACLPRVEAQRSAQRAKRAENVAGNLCRYGMDLAFRTRPPEEALRLHEVLQAMREVARALGRAADLVADITVKEQ